MLVQAARTDLVHRLLSNKEASSLSFNNIGQALGVTNVYAAQLFYNQAQLKPHTASKLTDLFAKHQVPILADDIALMQKAPFRFWDDEIVKEPLIYRLSEAYQHFGESIKLVMNEKFGDGIMSAIDFIVTVEKVVGAYGEPRVLLTFNGKFLPHTEHLTSLADKVTQPGQSSSFATPPALPTVQLPNIPSLASSYQCPSTAIALKGQEKQAFISNLHLLKADARLTFDDIGQHLGVTNLYAAQLFNNQAQLKPDTAVKLQQILPKLTPAHLSIMSLPPMRSWDDSIMKEPNVYRTVEACRHYGYGIKAVVNEIFGDGIMSGIDFFMAMRRAQGTHGEARVVITMNGKYLPHVEQNAVDLDGMSFE